MWQSKIAWLGVRHVRVTEVTRTRVLLLLVFAAATVCLFELDANGTTLAMLSKAKFEPDAHGVPVMVSEAKSLSALLGTVLAVAAAYELLLLLVAVFVRARKGAPSEVQMLGALLRALAVLVIMIELLRSVGRLPAWAPIAAFAGMLMGWSLQAPVSGLAAWVFVNVKRPFRLGDRVMLPAWGLTGDIKEIGMMYTVLNQVGGTVGSEEAAGRDVLIPNAMLFGNVVINYTPMQAAAYVLDEVIIRITYSSDWEVAEKVLMDAASDVTGDIIQKTGQAPYIRADMYDYGVYMRLRYMTLAMDRPRIVYEITRRIYQEFQKRTDVDFAIPYVFSHRAGLEAAARHLEPKQSAPSPHVEIEVAQIHDPSGVAARTENASQVQGLAEKIAQLGLLQPIVVERREDGQFNVIAGHLRLAACKMLGWKTISAIAKMST